jgi:hypothetical protein
LINAMATAVAYIWAWWMSLNESASTRQLLETFVLVHSIVKILKTPVSVRIGKQVPAMAFTILAAFNHNGTHFGPAAI